MSSVYFNRMRSLMIPIKSVVVVYVCFPITIRDMISVNLILEQCHITLNVMMSLTIDEVTQWSKKHNPHFPFPLWVIFAYSTPTLHAISLSYKHKPSHLFARPHRVGFHNGWRKALHTPRNICQSCKQELKVVRPAENENDILTSLLYGINKHYNIMDMIKNPF